MKKIKWYLSLLVIWPFITNTGNAQSIKRQCISSYGVGGTIHGTYFNQTIGQPFLTSTFQSSDLRINPGFQQSIFYRVNEERPEEVETTVLNVYPNPAQTTINIAFINNIPEKFYIKVVDMNGRVMFDKYFIETGTKTIDCNEWTEGFYVVSVFDQEQQKYYKSKVLIIKQ